MRLTKNMRAAFVNAVIADTNVSLDNDAVRKRVMDEALAALPAEVKSILGNPMLSDFVNRITVRFDSLKRSRPQCTYDHISVDGVVVPGKPSWKPSAATHAWVKTLQRDVEARMDARDDLRHQLGAMAEKCMTRDALVALLPHLEKYMPAPPAPGMTYAVTTGSVEDMMKVLGRLGVPSPTKKVAATV